MIVIVIALFVAGLFLTEAFVEPHLGHHMLNATSHYQAQPNPASTAIPNKGILDVWQSANPDVGGSWYSPMNPNYQPDYYWYSSPHDGSWSNAFRNWWCQ